MINVAVTLLLFVWSFFCHFILPKQNTEVHWQKPEQLSAFQLGKTGKPLLIDVYTDWCHYCKLMDGTTWKHDALSDYVNEKFIPVKLNAETRDELLWQGRNYSYQPRYKVNMLAVEILKGNMTYPSTVIITPEGDVQVLRGALKPKEIELALTYYGSGSYKSMEFVAFQRQFSATWY